ncbi:MAG: Ig-like domain-containing protein [Bifidobacteriaceae bacterium]|nr:Ig-like domain-containing protein [Bifidobacteriaceae bacterium]
MVSEFEGKFPVVGVVGTERSASQDARFVNDSADSATSWFQVRASQGNKTDPATADGKESYVVRVNLRNSDGDPVNGRPATIGIAGGQHGPRFFTVTTSQIEGQSGTAEFVFTSTEAGTFTISAEVAGDALSQPAAGSTGKSVDVVFAAGAASSTKSFLVGPRTGPAKANGGEQQVVEAHVFDVWENPVTTGAVTFQVPDAVTAVGLASGAPVDGPQEVSVALDSNGVATIAMVSLVKGEYKVDAKVGELEITQGAPAVLQFTNAGVSAAGSKFSIPSSGEVKTVRRESHTLRVDLFDQSGNAYTDASEPVTFRWRLDGSTSWTGEGTGSRAVASASGVAEWPSWTVPLAGVYEVEAWIGEGQVGTSLKAAFKADSALPSASEFSSSTGTVVENDGKAKHFAQVRVLDAVTQGNPVEGQDVVFTVTGEARIVGAADPGTEATVRSSDLGFARIEIVDAKDAGGETVIVKAFVNGDEVGSDPLEFGPGSADVDESNLSVRPTTALSPAHPGVTANGADSYTATATVKDFAGQVLVGQAVFFAPSAGLTVVESGPFQTNSQGQVSVTVTSRAAGQHSLRALLGAVAMSPGSVELTFVSGPMASLTSHLEAPAASAIADGSDPLTVAAHVLDANSNPLAGADVEFALPAGADVQGEAPGQSVFAAKTDASGRAEVVLVSKRADSYEVTARAKPQGTADWIPVDGNSPATAIFVAGPIDPMYSQISRSPAGPLTVGAAAAGYEVRVDLLDQNSNPVKREGVAVQYRFFLAAPQGPISDPDAYCSQAPDGATRTASALTDADGTARVRFLSNLAGPWHGCAFYAGDQIVGGSPVPLAFAAGPVDQAVSELTVSQNAAYADGKAAHYAKVKVTDSHGNPLGGRDVDIAIEEGAAGVKGPNIKGSADSSARVSTCDPAQGSSAPEYCTVGGVFQAGLAYVEFTSEEPGVFAVTATVDGLPVSGSPQTVAFTAGNPTSGESSWRISPNTADPVTGGSVSRPATGSPDDFYSLTVEVQSQEGLLVPGVPVKISGLSSVVSGALEGVTGAPESGSLGQHTWKLYSAATGTYWGQIQMWNGATWESVGAKFLVRFAAGAPVTGNSWLVEPPAAVSVAGPAPALLQARVVDAQGHPADQATVVFQLPADVWPEGRPQDAGSTIEASVSAGAAVARLSAEKAGRYGVSASIKDADPSAIMTVKDSEGVILSDQGLAYVTFTAGAASGRDSSLSIPTATGPLPVGGGYHRAEVRVTDRYGNPVTGPEVTFYWAQGAAAGPSGSVWNRVDTPVSAGPDGVAAYEFAAPGNLAGWVWIKASVAGAAGAETVGAPQTAPVASQTVVGAQFTAGTPATATLVTYGGAVPNDLEGRSWARVVVSDAYGNGVGGVPVAFALPSAAGSPVFWEQDAPGDAAATVETCGDEPAVPSAACLVGGVHTPGLALVEVVSAYEGTFPVGAVAGTGPDGIVLTPSDVVFSSGAASAAASSFTLARTDAQATHVVADAVQSYTLTVTAANGVSGAVAGACVVPELPVGVTVAAPESGAPCQAGEYPTDSSGAAALRIVSRLTGLADVGVKLGGSPVATQAGGSVYTVDALFVGGPPSGPHSELTSPDAPVRADDPDGLTLLATVRDAFGNLAACWDGATAVPCEVDFWVPAGTRVGNGEAVVTGPAWLTGVPAGVVDYGSSRLRSVAAEAGVAQMVYFGDEGTYQVGARVSGQTFGLADGTDWAPDEAKATLVFTDAAAPGKPSVDPSDGGSVTGTVDPEDLGDAEDGGLTVVVKDGDGNTVATCPVAPDGSFDCPISPKLPDGSEVTVEVVDQAGNASDPVDIVTDATAPGRPVVHPSDGSEIDGIGQTPGDKIVVKDEDGNTLCETVVGTDKTWGCVLAPNAKEGDTLVIVEEDQSGNAVERPWRVGVPRLSLAKATVCGNERQAVMAENFQPSEPVTLWAAGAEDVAPAVASDDGRVEFEWTVSPEARDQQAVRLTGPESGSVTGAFAVACAGQPEPPAKPVPPGAAGKLPFTGVAGAVALAGTALALLALGCWFLIAAARRRRAGRTT